MEQIFEKYFLQGDKVIPANVFSDFLNQPGIYIFEVLRVISGIPLFVDEHLERLQMSAIKSGYAQNIDLNSAKNRILTLIKENKTESGNIKIVCRYFRNKIFSWTYFIPYNYPNEQDYREGVKVGTLQAERTNPEAKTIQPGVRETANKKINAQNIYEVLLIDNQGFIREGSRSNVFFIKGNEVVTPPQAKVLNGITRQKVIDILLPDRCSFKENQVAFADLDNFDALFLTGTSPKVLPVSQVDGFEFQTQNPVCKKIMNQYNLMIENYISSYK